MSSSLEPKICQYYDFFLLISILQDQIVISLLLSLLSLFSAWIEETNIKPYLMHKEELVKANKSAPFKEAIEEIENYRKDNGTVSHKMSVQYMRQTFFSVAVSILLIYFSLALPIMWYSMLYVDRKVSWSALLVDPNFLLFLLSILG